MRMKSLFLIILYFSIGILHAKTRTNSDAIQIASSFFQTTPRSAMQKISASDQILNLTYKKSALKAAIDSIVCYYVYNRGENNGYIIVSGDDRATPVLGYSDSGNFDFSVIPENFKSWLSFYESELKSLEEDNLTKATIIKSVSPNKTKQINTFATSISPLLGGIKWDQGAPYNSLCPIIDSSTGKKAVTGCVATAMAQVMRYYKWPAQGTGSNSYTTDTLNIPLALDFAQTTFDWDNMSETYGSTSTAAQNNAVATLMYNCGVSVNMNYNTSSNALVKRMAIALKTNFGYDENIQRYKREYFDRGEWINLMKTELNASRPVLYEGYTNNGGHEFVCDGYDSNDLFHFNWGWGGISNGYFQISALDPDEQGIGSSTGGYNSNQTIVIGVQKPNIASVPSYLIHTDLPLEVSAETFTRTESFTLTVNKLYNMGINTFTGNIGAALYNSEGFVQILRSYNVTDLRADYGESTFPVQITLPLTVANGTYKIYGVYKATDESEWQIIRGKVGTPNFLSLTVDATTINITQPTDVYPELILNSMSLSGKLYKDKTGRFNVSVTNTGGEYNSILGIYLQSTTDETINQLVTNESVNIATGETRNLLFTGKITMEPGEYSFATIYDTGNNKSIATITDFYPLGDFQIVNVLETPTDSPLLTLSSSISFPNSGDVNKENAVLTATIKNTSGFFDNKLVAYIFPATTGSSLTYLGYQDAIFDTNEEKEVTFSGSINLEPGQYRIGVYSKNETNAWTRIAPNEFSLINFTLVDVYTGTSVLTPGCFEIYPNPVRNNLKLRTTTLIHRIVVTDLLGKQIKTVSPAKNELISISVDDLKSGAYLIRIETDAESKTMKFIKN